MRLERVPPLGGVCLALDVVESVRNRKHAFVASSYYHYFHRYGDDCCYDYDCDYDCDYDDDCCYCYIFS